MFMMSVSNFLGVISNTLTVTSNNHSLHLYTTYSQHLEIFRKTTLITLITFAPVDLRVDRAEASNTSICPCCYLSFMYFVKKHDDRVSGLLVVSLTSRGIRSVTALVQGCR